MRLLPLLLAPLLLAPLALGEASVLERNVAYFDAMIGEADRAQVATLHDGRTMTLAAAIRDAAARAGARDLAALTAGAGDDESLPPVGDVWVFEVGDGPCESAVVASVPIMPVIDPQFWWYAGGLGTLSTTHGSYTQIVGWTTKTTIFASPTAGFTAVGNQDFYCFSFSGLHVAFPFVDGTAFLN